VDTSEAFLSTVDRTAPAVTPLKRWQMPSRSLLILRKAT